MKKWYAGLLVIAVACAMGLPVPAFADGVNPVTVTISMPQDHFVPGDIFWMSLETFSNSLTPVDCRLFVLMQVMDGNYWYPSWVYYGSPDYELDWENVTVHNEVRTIIEKFVFPDIDSKIANIRFAAVCTDAHYQIISNIDEAFWSYGP